MSSISQTQHSPDALVVLPAGRNGAIQEPEMRQWLSQGRLSLNDQPLTVLGGILQALGKPDEVDCSAALRFWGQTGERSSAWMAALDAVHLEARLDHLCLYSLAAEDMPVSDYRELLASLQSALGNDDYAFARLGSCGYIRGDTPFATASLPAALLNGMPPDQFMPQGRAAAACDQLLSEMQMVLHDHAVNQRRLELGQPEANSFWIWGGGTAPEPIAEYLPPLFSDDPLLLGCWYSRTAVAEPWPGQLSDCLALAVHSFVAVSPPEVSVDDCLAELHALQSAGRVRDITLLFGDGLRVDLKRNDRFRFWRRRAACLEAQ